MTPLLLLLLVLCDGTPLNVLRPALLPRVAPLLDTAHHVKDTRIVGGTISAPHRWPHMAALMVDVNVFCGGTLISDQWVLTAAHCIHRHEEVEITLGAHILSNHEPSQVKLTSQDFIVHESYGTAGNEYDIGLIRLPEPVTFDANIASIQLADHDLSYGTPVTATGWGVLSDDSSALSDVLRQVTMHIVDKGVCDTIYGPQGDGELCVDAGEGGICDGDSGGPLTHEDRIYGITSYASGLGCESGWPEGFTSVFHYLEWIQSHSGITP